MLRHDYGDGSALVLAVPAGGVPVAIEVARELSAGLDVAVASKLTPPQNTEVGFGAVAWDGSFRLNRRLVSSLGLTDEQMQAELTRANRKVQRRAEHLRDGADMPEMAGRPVILVDDGLATGVTMLVAAEAVGNAGATDVAVAVPTAHEDAVRRVRAEVRRVYVANLRNGHRFAVAEAYRRWHDVSEDEAARLLRRFRKERS
jgi:predicted phosphoribosyltransferase